MNVRELITYLYRITNVKTCREYVGITCKQPLQRFCEHYVFDSDLGRDMRSIGCDQFSIHLLGSYQNRLDAEAAEYAIITEYFAKGKECYNSNHGVTCNDHLSDASITMFHRPLRLVIEDDIKEFLSRLPSKEEINEFFGCEHVTIAPSPLFIELIDLFASSNYVETTKRNYASQCRLYLESQNIASIHEYITAREKGQLREFTPQEARRHQQAIKALDLMLSIDDDSPLYKEIVTLFERSKYSETTRRNYALLCKEYLDTLNVACIREYAKNNDIIDKKYQRAIKALDKLYLSPDV